MPKNITKQPFVRIKLVGFNKADKSKFESILAIAERRLDAPWHIVDTMETDYFLLNSRLKSQFAQDTLLQSLPRQLCIFYTYNTKTTKQDELVIASDNIPSLSSLVSLFNRLSHSTKKHAYNDLSSIAAQAVVTTPVQPLQAQKEVIKPEHDFFDPKQGFTGLLLNTKGIQCLNIEKSTASDPLYINFEQKTYYCNKKLEQLDTFFSSQQSLTTQSLSEQQLQQKIAVKELKPQPLTNLLWYASFCCSQGKPITGYKVQDIVHLKRWPDINLPGCRKLIKLAAFMQSNAVDLQTTQQQTGFTMQQIFNFYNACKVIGLIEQSQQKDLHEKNLNHEKRQLFAKIGKRLKQTQ